MLRLEPATEHDLPLMMAWRSNPLVYEGFYQQDAPLEWNGHVEWFRSRNQDWRTFIVWYAPSREAWEGGGDHPVGVVTIGQLDHWSPEIGLYLGEVSLWGQRVGKQMLQAAIDWLKEYSLGHKHVVACHSTILHSNKRSGRLFQRLGFRDKLVDARDGEHWVFREL